MAAKQEDVAVEFANASDLEPMYQLEAEDQDRAINNMANHLIDVILTPRQSDQEKTAQAIAKSAAQILEACDSDLVEHAFTGLAL